MKNSKNCILCNSKIKPHSIYKFKSEIFKSIYTDNQIYKCISCGLRQIDRHSLNNNSLAEYYTGKYRSNAGIATANEQHIKLYYQARAKALAKLINSKPEKVFEPGCGYGYNLKEVKSLYPSAQLFTDELDTTIDFVEPSIKRIHNEDNTYDVIILSHVLEHFYDPVDVLKQIKKRLNQNGTLIIEVPNDVEGIFTITGCDEPHLSFFTKATLELCLKKAEVTFDNTKYFKIFTAGPDYQVVDQSNSIKKQFKKLVLRIANHLPPLKKFILSKLNKKWGEIDLSLPNDKGKYLRAVVKLCH